ncbi:hypothetical protein H112_04145 [Trichophyton rubrum D6]|uniref:Uncharacterized protein n=2 Tax=Trichophyton TaxID=5550 RepID=A0A022W3B6_TRIRU|nr:hypothetical protein H100_04150 [Trichophyton rubrum MR850]EZF42203.1 hypothetical protein H102_04138 [Trichophyton rubrum CBS 100081]EZF52852.1 hypothetical protein H103_04149 [Trichophyton rubrum CBS 288.86]EZF63452.1 hypothetical protein H104_04135 [Trichophyton rubrum CBS 289.86]EZF74040.1 hypothetical protein H105_04167 [Trichophyton soudanense CBS 452.61]EZF84763.1 hypothetical protein H110_04142 [Trichophyton rubrum MR1448]EZF95491.1 hypothetical protein H113_04179 [Trichophyton rub
MHRVILHRRRQHQHQLLRALPSIAVVFLSCPVLPVPFLSCYQTAQVACAACPSLATIAFPASRCLNTVAGLCSASRCVFPDIYQVCLFGLPSPCCSRHSSRSIYRKPSSR